MPPVHKRAAAALASVVAASSVIGGALAFVGPASASTTATSGSTSVAPSDDAYIDTAYPTRTTGKAGKLVADKDDKISYLKFHVPSVPTGAVITEASIVLHLQRGQSGSPVLHGVASSSWTEGTINARNAPKREAALVQGRTSGSTVSFSVATAVTPGTITSFAVVNGSGLSAFNSDEASSSRPRLHVKWAVPTDTSSPTPTATASPTPTSSPTPPETAESTPAPTVQAPTLFGANVYRDGGITYADALKLANEKYTPLDVVRVFYPGLPAAWPGNAGMHGGPVVVSFKASPSDILAGKHDAFFTDWFAKAPRDRIVDWVYFHEPEDDIERGSFTAADYRAAWRRLDNLADKADNPQLKSTLVLMCWTVNEKSGRNWNDYFAGTDVIDVMGWDCYNTTWEQGVYTEPERIYSTAANLARSLGKPFGYAEFGSPVAVGDDGHGRADWLRASASWMTTNGARWGTYFDAPTPGHEFRLLDEASSSAWREVVSGS